MGWRRVLLRVGLAMGAIVLLLQLVPYGWWHENPPVRSAMPMTGEAAEIFEGACADCHSNETEWPLYSYVAPMSWLVRRDVEAGRDAFNTSDWDDYEGEADDAAEAVEDGDMPPRQYRLAHPAARLSQEEQQILIQAFESLDDGDDPGRRDRGRDD